MRKYILGFLVFLFFYSLFNSYQGTTKSESTGIFYMVEGTASVANVTYSIAGSTSQEQKVSLPWMQTVYAKKGDFLYVSAQNAGRGGNITVKIFESGTMRLINSATSSGEYSIASTSSTL